MKPMRAYDSDDRSNRLVGLAVVVVLHALVIWALMTGLVRQAIEVVKKPIEVAIVDLPKAPPPPPPPPLPPPPTPAPTPPKVVAPVDRPLTPPPPSPAAAPAVVPRPEVEVAPAAPAPAIQVQQAAPPAEPPRPPSPPAPPAPPAPAPAVAAPPSGPRAEIAVVCPGYKEILNSALAGAWDRVGITGVVKVQIRVRGGQIVDVTPLSGPREYHRLVQTAVRRMRCAVDGVDELLVPLEVSFREPS